MSTSSILHTLSVVDLSSLIFLIGIEFANVAAKALLLILADSRQSVDFSFFVALFLNLLAVGFRGEGVVLFKKGSDIMRAICRIGFRLG